MHINLTKPLPLLLILILCITGFSVHAESTEEETATEKTMKDSDESRLAESQEILANIRQLTQQSSELKEVAREIPDFDQLLFITLLIDIENDLSGELERLVSIHQKLDKSFPETQHLLKEIQQLTRKQESLVRKEIYILKSLFPKLHKQANKDSSTSLSIDRAKQLIFDLLVEWQKNIERQKLLNMDVDASVKELSKIVQFVAITQTARIRLSIDAIAELKTAMKETGADEQKQITKLLHKEELHKSIAAKNLEKMLGIMTRLEMDTTKFGQALVIATGEILHADVETEAVIGLFKQLLNHSMLWLQDNLPFILFRIISFILIILAFRIIASIVRRLVDKATSSETFDASQLLKDFLGSITQRIIMLIGFMIALSQLGIEIGPLLAGMGIMGFVVGFALQDTLSNFASGLMILVYRPFDIGNFVDVAGINGVVKQMNLVSTTILTIDRKRMIIPNSKIWGNIITNVTAENIRRVDFVFSIGHHDNINTVEDIFQDIVEKHELVLNTPETVIKLHTLGESSIDFIVRPWVNGEDYWNVYWDITRQVKERFDENSIFTPHPQRDIHIIQEANKNSL
ncbi:MAG: mechanosensitive ion channel [Methyloprofundus sp.]|nr:mechanosensitive ion channel [Methyloprofundus sp.]